jgi:hypothetical protein
MLGWLTPFFIDVCGSPLDRETILFHHAHGLEHVGIRVADVMFDDTYSLPFLPRSWTASLHFLLRERSFGATHSIAARFHFYLKLGVKS